MPSECATATSCSDLLCRGAGQLDQAIFSLTAKVMHHESLAAAATEKSLAAAKAEHELQLAELQLVVQQHATGADQLQQVVDELQEELQQVRYHGNVHNTSVWPPGC